MVVQRVFKVLGRWFKGKERYMQPYAGNITEICDRVASRREGIADKLPVFSR